MSTSAQARNRRFAAPLRAPVERRTWRELLYVLTGPPLAAFAFAVAVVFLAAGAGLAVTFLGLPLLAAGLAGCRTLGRLERARARALLGLRVPEPDPVRTAGGQRRGPLPWMWAQLRSGVSWRHLLYAVVSLPWALCSFALCVAFCGYGWALLSYPAWQWVFPRYLDQPGLQVAGTRDGALYLDSPGELALAAVVGLALLLAAPYVVRGCNRVAGLLVGGLLGPSQLAERVQELEWDRSAVADAATADLRRIERDLHDGAQARLVTLAMDLGLAKEKLPHDPEGAAGIVDSAHHEAKQALQELRDLARGIHPAILTDRGLGPALSHLAARCTARTTVSAELDERPAPAIEAIAYYTASELLQNVSKHSGAASAHIDLWRAERYLMLTLTDDGRGGATAKQGGGLAGLADRLAAVDGLLLIDSPAGGPTTISAQLPWRDP